MKKYKALQHFTWGQLELEKGQTYLIEDLGKNSQGNERSLVSKQYYPEEKQVVGTRAIQTMVELKKIEEYKF